MKYLFKLKSALYLVVVLCFLNSTNTYSQWKYETIKNLDKELCIEYEVTYDNPPNQNRQRSRRYVSKMVVLVNQNKLIERQYGQNGSLRTTILLDYTNNTCYNCFPSRTSKMALSRDFKLPVRNAVLQKGESKKIADFDCDKYVSIVNGKPVELYATKAIGLRYAKKHTVEGFLLEYTGFDTLLGFYTVKATKTTKLKLPEQTFSLDGYNVISYDNYKSENNITIKTIEEKKQTIAEMFKSMSKMITELLEEE